MPKVSITKRNSSVYSAIVPSDVNYELSNVTSSFSSQKYPSAEKTLSNTSFNNTSYNQDYSASSDASKYSSLIFSFFKI